MTNTWKAPERSVRWAPLILLLPALLAVAAAVIWGVPMAEDWLMAGLKAVVIP